MTGSVHPTAPRRATEAECQRTIVEAARLAGWMVHAERPATMQSGRWATPIQGDAGWPDLVLLHPLHRVLWFVELKREPNKVEPAQQRWLDELSRSTFGQCGVRVLWVPEELDEFIAELCAVSAVGVTPQ